MKAESIRTTSGPIAPLPRVKDGTAVAGILSRILRLP